MESKDISFEDGIYVYINNLTESDKNRLRGLNLSYRDHKTTFKKFDLDKFPWGCLGFRKLDGEYAFDVSGSTEIDTGSEFCDLVEIAIKEEAKSTPVLPFNEPTAKDATEHLVTTYNILESLNNWPIGKKPHSLILSRLSGKPWRGSILKRQIFSKCLL